MLTRRTWLVPFEALTPQQRAVTALGTDSHHVVFGPAGSGKTLLLLYRARYLLREKGISPDRLRVLVYTNTLKGYIRTGITTLGLPPEVVQTFYTWVSDLAKKLPVRLSALEEGDDQYLAKLIEVLRVVEHSWLTPSLEAVLVDEGQDLPPEAYKLLAKVAKHVTVFADYAQQLYSNGAHVGEIADSLDVRRESAVFLQNFRNSLSVARVAACFLPAAQRSQYLETHRGSAETEQVRTPVLFRGQSPDDEWQYVATILADEIRENRHVGILLPNQILVGSAVKHLTAAGVPVMRVRSRPSGAVDFNDTTPKVLTIYGAKGLTFDTVILPRLWRKWYADHPHSTPRALLFVGVTRAASWVCLSTVNGREVAELADLAPLIQAGHLQVVQPTARSTGTNRLTDLDDLPL